jgi:AcrR family transcriptional regulator
VIQASRVPAASARIVQFEATRDLLLRSARDAVAQQGWQGAQIALIATRAGVATGSVYRYFESKAALYAQVLARVSQREVDLVAAVADAAGPPRERLAQAIRLFMTRALQGRRLAYALIVEPCEPEIDRARLAYREALARQIARIVQQGVEQGAFAAVDVTVAASCITGAFMEALVGPLAPTVKAQSKAAGALLDQTVSLCVAMLPAPARRSRS